MWEGSFRPSIVLVVAFSHWILGVSLAWMILCHNKGPLDSRVMEGEKILGPLSWVKNKVVGWMRKKRLNAQVALEWPSILEALSIAALSGLDLVSAFRVASKRATGLLQKELDKVDARVLGGVPLKDALSVIDLGEASPVRRLQALLSQAQILGTPVAEILENLAEERETYERQRFEERLNGLPVKLSVITVLFLLPPVIIISVAPHILKFLGAKW